MSKKTIYLEDAINAVISLCDDCDSGYCGSCRVNYPGEKDAIKALKDLSSAQPEIIHCKDCIWHNKDINQCDRQVCAVMYTDDFCNYGERRGEQR